MTRKPSGIRIRYAAETDAEPVANLSSQLGYPAPVETMAARLRTLGNSPQHAVMLAIDKDQEVIGWIDIGTTQHLQSEPYAEIGGLVVAEAHRSRGVGRELVKAAEQWAREKSIQIIRVRSNVTRVDAHRFYERENYTRSKTSAVFDKRL